MQGDSEMVTLTVPTPVRTSFVDITAKVAACVRDLEITNGTVLIFVPHTTAGITINENADPDVMNDIAAALERMVPWKAGYAHCEGNAAGHVKASLMGSSIHVIVRDGRLMLGTWQGIYLCEFDGPRTRNVWVSAG